MPSPRRVPLSFARQLPLALVVALVGTLPALARADDPAPAPAAPPAAAPPVMAPPVMAPPAPAGPAGIADEARRAAILAIVDDLRDDAARIRGLPWKFPVPADVISRAEMRKDFERQVREELKPDVYARELKLARRLGVLGADDDPIAMTLTFMERGVAGYYDPKRRHFYVVDGLSGEAQRPTILHELVHALEDQYFDLRKQVEPLEEDGDAMFAMKCVQEGSAELARKRYERENPAVARLAQAEQRKSPDNDAMLKAITAVPASLVVGTLLNYQTGPAFVGRAVGRGDYLATMARLYADPPRTQEQVLRPSRFLGARRDLPRRITWPTGLASAVGEGWAGLKPAPVGELDLALWVDRWVGGTDGRLTPKLLGSGRYYSPEAGTAAEGWDGALVQLLEEGGVPRGIAALLAFDTAKDANEAAETLRKALRAQHGDTFRDGAWRDGPDGARTATFSDRFGAGRLEVKGEIVRLLDGVPVETLERAFAALAAAPVERDTGDGWTPEAEGDPFAGATWTSAQGKTAWSAPDAAYTTTVDGTALIATKGDLTVQLETVPGDAAAAFGKAIGMLVGRHKGAVPDVQNVEELMVGTQGAARLRLDDRSGAAPQARWVYVVPLADHLLLVTVGAPKATFDAHADDVDRIVEGLAFRE